MESRTVLVNTTCLSSSIDPHQTNITSLLQPGLALVVQLRRRHLWPIRSMLLWEAYILFEDAWRFLESSGDKVFKIRENPTIMVEFAVRPDTLHAKLHASVEKAREKRSVLDRLGRSKRFLDTVLGLGVAISELNPIANAVLGCVKVVYNKLEEHDQCDKLILDLAEDMARTLGYIEDVEQFARIYQLKSSIEDIRPLMEDTANFILAFTKHSGLTHSWPYHDEVNELAKRYKNFKDQFDRGIAVQSGANLAGLLEAMILAKDDDLLMPLKPKGLETRTHIAECMQGTREDIMASIAQWIDDIEAKNILWVRGFPGVGKSTIASSLIERIRMSHRLGSSFVFDRAEAATMTTTALWRQVAFDLARTYPTVRKVVVAKLDEGIVQPSTSNVNMLFRNLIDVPLRASNDIPPGRLPIVVVDALDECGGLDGRQSAQRVGLLQSLKLWSQLPSRFKLVVTSRREDDILRVLTPLCHTIDISSGNTVNRQASEDIRLFFTSCFSKIANDYPESLEPSWPGETIIADLTSRAAGLFIWAKTAANFVNAGEPKEQLRQIRTGGIGFGDMAALYTHILHMSFKNPSTEVLCSFKHIVGATILVRIPLRRMECIDLLGIQPTMLDFIRNGLRSVMDAGDVLRFSHQSFVDFLIDPLKCPRPFLINEGDQQRVLAVATLRVLKHGLRFNIGGLETSLVLDHDVPGLDDRVKKSVSPHLSYACRFWADHLSATSYEPDILEDLRHLLNENFLHWLEVLSLLKEINVVAPALKTVINWCPSQETDLPAFARDALKFTAAFGPVIAQSIPHIYISALPFAPQNSIVFQRYSPRFPRTLSLQTGRVANWPAIQYVAEGHALSVYSVRFSHHGKYFASASGDRTIRIWDTETGSLVSGPLKGHRDAVKSVAFSPDDNLIASGSDDWTVRVWDVESGDLVSAELGHMGSVTSVVFSKDGRSLISGSEDKTIRVWDVYTGDIILPLFERHVDAVTTVVLTQDQKHIISNSSNRTMIIWDATTGHPIASPRDRGRECVAISPDGTRFASCAYYQTVVRDVTTGALISQPLGHRNYGVNPVAFSRDNMKFASSSIDRTVRVWDTQTGTTISGPFRGHLDHVTSVDFSVDGTRIASASHDGTIRVWDTGATDTIDSRRRLLSAMHSHLFSEVINPMVFSRDGKDIIYGSFEGIEIWNAETGELKADLSGLNNVIAIAVSHDSKKIVLGSLNRDVIIWDVETGLIQGQRKVPDDLKTIAAVVFYHPDDTHIAVSTSGGMIWIWDIATGQASILRHSLAHWDNISPFNSIAFSPNGQWIVCMFNHNIEVWNVQTGDSGSTERFEGDEGNVARFAFSPNSSFVASISKDNAIEVWDLSTGHPAKVKSFGHSSFVVALAYSADGKYLASGCIDKTIRIWNAEDGSLVQGPLEGHSGEIQSVAFSQDGKRVISASSDKTIRVWLTDKNCDAGSFSATEQELGLNDDWKVRNGWVNSSDMSILFWVPPWNRDGLWWPRNTGVIAEVLTKLNFDHFAFGARWYQCREPTGVVEP